MKNHFLIVMVITFIFLEIRNDASVYTANVQARFLSPIVNPKYTSYFGDRRDPTRKRNIGGGSWKKHTGVDMTAPKGSYVYSVDDGVVIMSRNKYRGYGTSIMIRHNDGTITLYGHLSDRLVRYGARVERGHIIGIIGSTGISTGRHLHFSEISPDGKIIDPMNHLTNKTIYY